MCHYRCQEELRPLLEAMCLRVLELFVRHICLIRPVKDGGKMKITSDMAQVCEYHSLNIVTEILTEREKKKKKEGRERERG